MRISNKTKNILKSVACIALVAATVLGVASLFSHKKDDLKEIKPAFSIGGLTEQGKYVEQDNTIYTKEAFECKDLRIDVDFEKTITYKVFFYADSGEFISATEELTENFVSAVPGGATHARVLITPDWKELEIVKNDEKVIKWYEIAKYAGQLTIKTAKADKEAEEITDLAGTTWIIDSTCEVESGFKMVGTAGKNMGIVSYYSPVADRYVTTSFDVVGLGYVEEGGAADSMTLFYGSNNSGISAELKDGYVLTITFATSNASTDTDLINFMLENATLQK